MTLKKGAFAIYRGVEAVALIEQKGSTWVVNFIRRDMNNLEKVVPEAHLEPFTERGASRAIGNHNMRIHAFNECLLYHEDGDDDAD